MSLGNIYNIKATQDEMCNPGVHTSYRNLGVTTKFWAPDGELAWNPVPLWKCRIIVLDNIRMDLKEVGCVHMDWTGLAQDRDRWRTLVSAVMNLRIP